MNLIGFLKDPKDAPPPTRVETREERLERRRREKAEQVAYKLEREIACWDPHKIKTCTEDPFKTLFIARIVSTNQVIGFILKIKLNHFLLQNYDTSESKLRREFEVYGPIKKVTDSIIVAITSTY